MSKRETKRQPVVVLTVGIAIIAVLVVFKDAIQHKITLTAALKETAVNAELIYELAENSSDPLEVYEAFWNTEKIPHRLAALRAYNRAQDPDRKNLPAWVQDATMDSDLHVRELALAILAAVRAPELEAVVHTWLLDPDPELKQLALRQARTSGLTNLSHAVAPLLNDPDIKVRIAAASTFRNWTDLDFGVRQIKLSGKYDQETATYSDEEPEKRKEVEDGIQEWISWWTESGVQLFPETEIPAAPGKTTVLSAPYFQLPDLAGNLVRLSDLRGKPVLLNFWATWCTACWTEIPDLIQLQDTMGKEVAIIGISLDGLPDQHALEHGHSHDEGAPLPNADTAHEELVNLVSGFVKRHKMNYTILLDPEGVTSELYVGNELPMNVLIDANGNMYRRFMGSRSLEGFQSMLNASLLK